MLEKLPHALGDAMKYMRAGDHKIVFHREETAGAPETLRLTSEAFEDGGPIPVVHTADGDKLSPPLAWSGSPDGTRCVVLFVEDFDAPSPEPLVHAIAWNLPAGGQLRTGELTDDSTVQTGRNSFMGGGWLAPDPPPGHGPHHYVFQIFALDQPLVLTGVPGRGAVLEEMDGHVIAKGRLTGVYQRA